MLVAAMACGCLPPAQDVQCIEDMDCNRFADGTCRTAPSGNRWCSYADSDCRSGYRYSDLDVGDGVSGQCAEVTYDLTVSVEGNGAGVVSSTSSELACSSGVCTRSLLEGSRVELAAEASSGGFLGWAQECRGAGPCAMVMDRDRAATALFGTPGHPRWVKQVGGMGMDSAMGVAVDGDGDVIAVGSFSESLQLGGITLTSAGSYDVFVVKLNGLTGDVMWAKRFGGLDYDEGSAVRTDASNNVYVMGRFMGIADFGGGELPPMGDDLFVLKLTSSGDHVWSRRLGGVGDEIGQDFALRDDVIAVVGSTNQSLTIGSASLSSLGTAPTDVYIAMLTTDGELLWSKSLGGSSSDSARGVALDSSGNVVAVGRFSGTVNFGGGPLTSASGGDDVFVVKYAGQTGTHLFSKRYGGTAFDSVASVAIDSMDNIIVVGEFRGVVNFGGPVALTAGNDGAIFVAKYTLAGAHLWARSFHAMSASSYGYQFPTSVAVDGAGDVVITGLFCGTISFGGAELSSASECSIRDSFTVRLSGAEGYHVSSVRAGSRADVARIALAPGGRPYLVGDFYVFADIGGHGLTPVSGVDSFILALAPL